MTSVFQYSFAHAARDHVGGVTITRVRHAGSGFTCFIYQCTLREDFDGAPDAYGRNNPRPVDAAHNAATALQHGLNPRDHLGSATNAPHVFDAGGHDFAYVGVVAANENEARGKFSIDKRPALEARARMGWVKHGKQAKWELIHLGPKDPGIFPAIQGAGSTGPGYFVSTTSAVANDSLAEWDQNRYVNANEIPYGAWAGWWRGLGVGLGDFGVALESLRGSTCGFVFADSGSGHVGEVSYKLLDTLTSSGGSDETKHTFLVFPNSGAGVAGKYTLNSVIQQQARQNVTRLNGIPGNREILAFLAGNTDRARFGAWQSGKTLQSEEFHSKYYAAYWGLKSLGFNSNKASADEPNYPIVGDGAD